MIPKIIHQIWIGPNPIPDFCKDAIQTVKDKNPDFDYKFWTNDDLVDFGLENILKDALTPAFAANVFRLKILEKFGGIHIDVDTVCHKNLNTLLQKYSNYSVSSNYIKNKFPDVGIIMSERGIDFSYVLIDCQLNEPIGFYWQRIKPKMIHEEEVGVSGEYLQDLRLNSWVETYRSNLATT
jgi:hypothetical protein